MAFFLKQRTILINLLILLYVWVAIVFNSYLCTYLVNSFDLVYVLAISTSIEEIFASAIGGVFFHNWGIKWSLLLCFGLSAVSALVISTYSLQHQDSWLFVVLFVILDFGMTAAFEIIYIAHTSVFPTLFASTSFGYCNFLARAVSGLAPQVAEVLSEPTPLIVMAGTSFLGFFLVILLKTDTTSLRESVVTNQAKWQHAKSSVSTSRQG